MKKIEELMVITMEECGELIQECSKSLRMNQFDREELKTEIADVMCMIELMVKNNVVTQQEITDGIDRKKQRLSQWSNLL